MKLIESPLAALTSAAHSCAVAICAVLAKHGVMADATAYVLPDAVESGSDKDHLAPIIKTSLKAPRLTKNGTGKAARGRLPIPIPASYLLPLAGDPGSAAERIVAALTDAILSGTVNGAASKAKRADIGLYRNKDTKRPCFRTAPDAEWRDALAMAARIAAPADVLLALTPPKRITRLQIICPRSAAMDKDHKHYSGSIPMAHAIKHHRPGGRAPFCYDCLAEGRETPWLLMIDADTPFVPATPAEPVAEPVADVPERIPA